MLPRPPISQEAALKLESDLGLILSSLRETEASPLSEITAAVGREVWGKYFNQESWEFQLQLERAPRGQVGSMNGNLQPELTAKRQSYGWKPRMPPTYLPFTRRMERHGGEVRSANMKGSRAFFPPSGPRPQATGAQLWWGGTLHTAFCGHLLQGLLLWGGSV